MPSFFELLPVLLLLLVSCLFLVISFVLLIAVFFLKERAQTIAINFLLGTASVPIAALLAITSVSIKPELTDSKIKAGFEHSNLDLNLSAATAYAVKHSPLIQAAVDHEFILESEQGLIKDAEFFEKERSDHRPTRKSKWLSKKNVWCAEYALVNYALGKSEDARASLERFEAADSTGVIKAVKAVTCDATKTSQSAEESASITAALKLLPAGWYREQALVYASKVFHDDKISEGVEASRAERGARALPAFTATLLLSLGMDLLGVLALVAGIRLHHKLLPNRENFHSKTITFRQVYGIVVFAIYFQLLTMLVGYQITAHTLGDATAERWGLPVGLLGEVAGYFVALYFFVLRKLENVSGWTLLSLDSALPTYPRLIATGIGIAGVSILFDTAWAAATARLFHNSTNNPITAQMISWSTHPTILIVLFAIVVAGVLVPIGEEIVFRAMFFGWLRKRFSVLVSVLIDGAIFAAAHGDPGQFVQIFVSGCLFAFVYARTRSLIPSIVAHSCMNCMSVLLTFLIGYAGKS